MLFEADGSGWPRHRLAPGERWEEGSSSLPSGLLPVVPVEALPSGKPARDAPAFWRHEVFRDWSERPEAEDRLARGAGRPALVHERRIHLAIDPATGTGVDGKLFQTDGLRLYERKAGEWHRMAFAVGCAHRELRAGAVTLGGERRPSALEPAAAPVEALLSGWRPPEIRNRRARVTLLTPALFQQGAVPRTIGGARVAAAAVGRPQTVSGWDMAWRNHKGGPKPTRRCAPAGSVYWVELGAEQDPADWAGRVHLGSVSDAEQDQRDGFGLAAVGVWE